MDTAVEVGNIFLAVSLFGFLAGLAFNTAVWRYRRKQHQGRQHMLEFTTEKPSTEPEREPFFSVDGAVFTIPVECPPVLAIRYLNDIRTAGAEVATARAFEALLGKDGLRMLAKVEQLDKKQLAQVMAKVQEKVMGVLEEAQGN